MDAVAILAIAALAGVVGIAFGIVVVAPRLSRLAEPPSEEPSDRADRAD